MGEGRWRTQPPSPPQTKQCLIQNDIDTSDDIPHQHAKTRKKEVMGTTQACLPGGREAFPPLQRGEGRPGALGARGRGDSHSKTSSAGRFLFRQVRGWAGNGAGGVSEKCNIPAKGGRGKQTKTGAGKKTESMFPNVHLLLLLPCIREG